jgi:hypothetical protein
MKAASLNIWLLCYGGCSLVAGVFVALCALRVQGGAQWFLAVFGAYLVVSGIAICLHSRLSPVLFLLSGLILLSWSVSRILSAGLGRTQLFGLLGSLITVHGYWVLQEQISKRGSPRR